MVAKRTKRRGKVYEHSSVSVSAEVMKVKLFGRQKDKKGRKSIRAQQCKCFRDERSSLEASTRSHLGLVPFLVAKRQTLGYLIERCM